MRARMQTVVLVFAILAASQLGQAPALAARAADGLPEMASDAAHTPATWSTRTGPVAGDASGWMADAVWPVTEGIWLWWLPGLLGTPAGAVRWAGEARHTSWSAGQAATWSTRVAAWDPASYASRSSNRVWSWELGSWRDRDAGSWGTRAVPEIYSNEERAGEEAEPGWDEDRGSGRDERESDERDRDIYEGHLWDDDPR